MSFSRMQVRKARREYRCETCSARLLPGNLYVRATASPGELWDTWQAFAYCLICSLAYDGGLEALKALKGWTPIGRLDLRVGGTLIKTNGIDAVWVVPQIFNDRIMIGPIDNTRGYSHGWCYDKDTAAGMVQAVLWDPDTQDEPADYKKKATPGRRVAPSRESVDA